MKTIIQKHLLGLTMFATLTLNAANVTVSDSIVTLAANGTLNYTFTDPSSGQSAVVALTITTFSPDPLASLMLLDGDTRAGVGNTNVGGDGHLIVPGEGVNLSASLVSATFGVVPSSVQFRITGLGLRAVDGTPTLYWRSSAAGSNNFALSTEAVIALDGGLFPLNGTNYSAQLGYPANDGTDFQLSDAGAIAGLGLVLNATFAITNGIDPRTNSWLTTYSGQYARIYTSDAAETAGTPVTTWNRGLGVQSLPTYCGINQVSYSGTWVYLRTTGLGSHVMGPWYLNVAHTMLFPNYPANTATLYRFPRSPVVSGSKTLTGNGPIGIFVDGVVMFDSRDAFSYSTTNASDAQPNGSFVGDGVWNRDAYVNEGVTFDAGNAHQAGKQYHYHANPPALRYLLGDHVTYYAPTNTYFEATNTPAHSPILGWVRDGYPVYGPYGYSISNNASSSVRRMISGYIKRDGSFGSTNLNITGRTTIPAWAALAQTRSVILPANRYGPTVSSTNILGHYIEDYDYLGDLGVTPGTNTFDLDQYNGRFCVTPEFPNGTYAYFVAIETNGIPRYPYNIGRWFYGNPTGTTGGTITEAVTTNFSGGTKIPLIAAAPAVNAGSGNVTLTWSAIDGGTYVVEATTNLTVWSAIATNAPGATQTNLPNSINTKSIVENSAASLMPNRYYRIRLSATNSYDSAGF